MRGWTGNGPPFSFAAEKEAGSFVAVKLQVIRKFLWLALLLCALFAAWSWFRPYAWNVDPGARCKVMGVEVKPDQSYFWLTAHLRMNSGESHDLRKPMVLLTASGDVVEPADTTFGGTVEHGTTDIWLKFWLESDQIIGPLSLRVHDGVLSIKSKRGAPAGAGFFVTHHW